MQSRTIKRSRGERGFGWVFGLVLLIWTFYIALLIGLVFVAVHFLSKVW